MRPATATRDWRGRGVVLLQFTLVACIVNSLALQLPGSTPFLVGNMAAVAVALRFGFALSVPVAACATAITGDVQWVLLAVLETLLVAHWRGRAWPALTLWWRVWLPLSPLVAWLTLPRGADDPVLWALSIAVVLATGLCSIVGGRQLAQVTRSRRQRAHQPMALQLSVQLSTLMAAPATVLVALLLQWLHQHDLQRSAIVLDARAQRLVDDVAGAIAAHRDVLAFAARRLSEGPAPAQATAVIADATAAVPGFLSLLVTDADGHVRVSIRRGQPPDSRRRTVADRSYFLDARASGRPTVTAAFLGRGLGTDPIVAVAAPLRDAQGRFAGVLQGSLALGQLGRMPRDMLDAEGFGYVVTDATGQAAVSSLPDVLVLAPRAEVEAHLAGRQAVPWWAARAFPAPTLGFDANGLHLVGRRSSDTLAWSAHVLQPIRPLARAQTLRSLIAAVFVLALIGGLQRIARRFAEGHTRGLAAIVARLRGLDPSMRGGSLDVAVDATSLELTELLRDFEAAEARLQAMHAALIEASDQQRALNRELEARVDQRTAELRDALARAEHLAAAKSSFLANMSHELRTPLAAILGYSEQGLRDEAGTAEMRRCLQTVVRNGRHLLEIVNDVLDASKIEAGQLRVQQQPIAPLPLLGEAIELLRPRAMEKGLQLLLSAHWPLPAQVAADPLRLKQVVLNLLSNAIKFTPSGLIAVRVRADADALAWTIEVEDTGIGMDAAQAERVFQRFEQADESTTRRFGGTGLGLYISRQLARQMGGDLTVSSTPGVGSRFLVSLPIGLDAAWVDDGEALPATAMPLAEANPRLRGRVLVVDDVDDLRLLLRTRVAATGAEVIEAANGREALDALRTGRPDLVLMDMHMPVMDGREAVARLRADGHQLPVYACSADVMEQDVAAFLALGCDGALAKPIDVGALHAVLRRHLRGADAVGAATPDDPLAAAMAQVRQRFIAQAASEQTSLARAAAAGDLEALRQQAHRLKGSAGTFGFAAVSDAAAALEVLLGPAADGVGAGASASASAPDERLAQAIALLDRHLGGLD